MFLKYLKYLKYIFIIFIWQFININHSYSQIVKEIQIKGNDRINVESIKMFSNINVGDDLDNDDLNEIIKKLYETEFFDNVSLDFNNQILTILVEENSIVQNLIIKGLKRQNSLKEEIEKTILIKEKSPYVESKVQLDLINLKNILQEFGYYFSNVNISKKENDNNTVDLIYELELGEKAFINEITFIGDKKFKKRKLLNVITSEENKFWKFLTSKRLVNNQRIQLDKRLLKNFYKNKGYYNAEVISETVQYQDNQNFKIIFNIEAGEKYNFGKFELVLPSDYDESFFLETKEKLNSFSNERYSYKIIEKMLLEIEKIALSEEYEFATANIDENINENNVDITISIEEPEVRSYVQKINILGNNITIEDVVRNEFIIDEGDPYNSVLFNKSINNVKGLNIFKSVKSEIIEGDDIFQKIININVEEKPTGEISLGAGIGTSGASTAFGVRENNFLGQGIRLDSNLQLSEETVQGQFSYSKPNFKNSDRDLILNVQSLETDRLKNFGYKTNKTGFSVGTGFEQFDDFYIKPSISTQYESIKTSSSASSLLKKQEGSYFDINGNYTLNYDKRDQVFQPTDGYLSSFSQQVPFNIEENQTLINTYEFNTYHEYIDDVIASLSIFGSAANSFGDDKVRISDRLFLPSKKLRGFERGKIGPKDGKDYVGGNYVTAVNLASNVPIFQSLETIDFNVFADAANVWGVDYNSSINDGSTIRTSTGVGVDWYTPIGPLSFSLAQPITKKSTDKTETFRFSLGTTF